MRNSYIEMLKALNIEDKYFINWGIKEIKELLPEKKLVEKEWKNLKKKIDSGKDVYIRGYGQDKNISGIQDLYKKAGFLCNIVCDTNNNSSPKKLMNIITNYRVQKRESNKFTAIQHYKISHIWGFTKNIYLFNTPWNMIYTPYIIDPFTGHETYDNNLKHQIKKVISNLIFNEYGCLIKDYNNILENDTRIRKIVEICECDKNDKFYIEMKKQWTKLTKNNILQG